MFKLKGTSTAFDDYHQDSFSTGKKIQNTVAHFSITYDSASLIVFAGFTGKYSVGIIAHVGEDQ